MIHWLRASDGVRLRAKRVEGGPDTILLMQGRTEYIEKYDSVIADLAARGFSVVTLDWRGQGLSDRALPDRMIGHVASFRDYATDIAAVAPLLRGRVFLLAHSMGGCIGLRWLIDGAKVEAAAFSAPMWGIPLGGLMRPLAGLVAGSSAVLNRAHLLAPGTSLKTYVLEAEFEGNTLTTDRAEWDVMQRHAREMPEVTLGGPSLGWVNAALRATKGLARLPSPAIPTMVTLGTGERVVDPVAVHQRMVNWPDCKLVLAEGAQHEIMMERPEIRDAFLNSAEALFRR